MVHHRCRRALYTQRGGKVHQRTDQFDRQRKHDRGVLFARNAAQRLEVAQLEGGWAFAHNVGRFL
uniref:Uncharacterized protein n=1 Tax=Anopheles christyi TaxID=43041 RepID=A0A182KIY4_9DIPT